MKVISVNDMDEMGRFEDIFEAIAFEDSISKRYHTTMRNRDGQYVVFGKEKRKRFGIF